jgi:exodeoxyribonuclease-5
MLDIPVDEAPVKSLPQAADGFRFGAQQEKGVISVDAWLQAHRKRSEARLVYRLFGYAGTGKTTIARHLAKGVNGKVCYAAYTGKAALMMQQNGCEGATTIHALLYKTVVQSDGSVRFKFNRKSPAAKAALIVIDECSMVDEKIGRDLERFGVPILVLGDPAQLPPVKGKGYFTQGCKPDTMLTEIHRQARDNPIIRFATDVREGRALPYGDFGKVVIDRPGRRSVEEVLVADQIIVGRNDTRHAFNARIRKHLGRPGPLPVVGDRLVCLRNDMTTGVLNGGLFKVSGSARDRGNNEIPLKVKSEDFTGQKDIVVRVRREFFEGGHEKLAWPEIEGTQQFDYGYALTGHKSQGSQWSHVIAYDESSTFGNQAQGWLYTVITRASEQLTLIR